MDEGTVTTAIEVAPVGRAALLDALARTLLDPTRAGALLRGAPGSGRTTTLGEAVARAEAGGAAVLAVAGRTADAMRPFASLDRALPGLLDEPGRPTASLLGRAVELVDATGCDALAIDDAHLLDGASAQVVHHLVAAQRWPVLLTAPTGAPLPEPIVALRVLGAVDVTTLEPLPDREVGALVEAMVGATIDEATQRRISVLSDGLPLHVVELVHAAAAQGALRAERGIVRWAAAAHQTWELGGLVRERVAAMGHDEREALALLALAGDVPMVDLERVLGPAGPRVAATAGLVRADGPTASIAHPVVAEVVLAAVPAAEIDGLRLQLADTIEAVGGTDASLRGLALRTEAGTAPPAPLLLDAAAEVLRRGDGALAADLYRQAVDHDPVPALLGLARSLAGTGRLDDARAAIASALAHPIAGADRMAAEVVAAELERRAGPASEARGRHLLALAADVDAPDADRRTVVEAAVVELVRAGAPADGLLAARQLLDEGAQLAPATQAALALALATLGQLDDALARLGPVAVDGDEVAALRVLELAGPVAELERRADELRGRAETQPGGEHDRAHGALASGLAALAAGATPRAARHLRRAVASLSTQQEGRAGCTLARARLVEALALQGDTDAAAEELAGLDEQPRSAPEDLDRARAALVLAAVQATGSERAAALAGALELATAAAGAGQRAPALELALLAWRAAGSAEAAHLVGALAADVSGPRAQAAAELVVAAKEHDGDAAQRAASALDGLGRSAEAAEAAALAASAFEAAGARRRAIAAGLDARRLATAADGPLLRATPPIELPTLTARELEIAVLVGDGRSNREIAEALYLSVRTVEGHVLRASTKVGVDDRAGLGRVAELLGQGRPR